MDSDNEDDDDDYIPTSNSRRKRKINCFEPIIQQLRLETTNTAKSTGPRTLIQIPLDELSQYNPTLVEAVEGNTLRYVKLFSSVIDGIVKPNEQDGSDAVEPDDHQNDLADGHGNAHDEQQQSSRRNTPGVTTGLPPELTRCFELVILPRGRSGTVAPWTDQVVVPTKAPASSQSLRNLRAMQLGHLVSIKGLIVRTSPVQPYCSVAAYVCDACTTEVYQSIGTTKQREFVPAFYCPACNSTKTTAESLSFEPRSSLFVSYQDVWIQEVPSQVPMGHVPRRLHVVLRGSHLTRTVQPGNVVGVDGIFLPQRIAESGYAAMKAGLVTTTYIEAMHVVQQQQDAESEDSLETGMTESDLDMAVLDIATSTNPDPLTRLSQSLAPEIFGHDDIKRALLLQLVGGSVRTLDQGNMRIRGDIHILLMGEPGVAKSQLLKYVTTTAIPTTTTNSRGIYTTGHGSSGVGLTAAVTSDPLTGEFALEAGALVLADGQGLTGIDEFDKLSETDRTALHEVMEQQTISIAKAGIVARLNARTAVLAAANPLYSRYHANKSLSENVNLPNSLLSRFDLTFIVLDTPNVDRDTALARHVTSVHQMKDQDESSEKPDNLVVPTHLLRAYITRARRYNPTIPPDVAPYVVEAYVALRQQDLSSSKKNDQTVLTARQLLSILRLSQACAKLRFSDTIAREDVDEAIRLTHQSKASLTNESTTAIRTDTTTQIYKLLSNESSSAASIPMMTVRNLVSRHGFSQQQLQQALDEYENLGVLQVTESGEGELQFIAAEE